MLKKIWSKMKKFFKKNKKEESFHQYNIKEIVDKFVKNNPSLCLKLPVNLWVHVLASLEIECQNAGEFLSDVKEMDDDVSLFIFNTFLTRTLVAEELYKNKVINDEMIKDSGMENFVNLFSGQTDNSNYLC